MAPEFEQYRKALRQNVEANVRRAQEELLKAQKQLGVLDGLPTINVFVQESKDYTYSLTMFARQATKDVLLSKPNTKGDSEQTLGVIFDISRSLASVGIDPDEEISLNPENPTPENNSPKTPLNKITFNGKSVWLSDRELEIFRYFEAKQATPITIKNLADARKISQENARMLLVRLRKKLEDDPKNPVFFVNARSEGRTKFFVYRSPERVASEGANQTTQT